VIIGCGVAARKPIINYVTTGAQQRWLMLKLRISDFSVQPHNHISLYSGIKPWPEAWDADWRCATLYTGG
jgi:hypothetical protein